MASPTAQNAAKTECVRGHRLGDENAYASDLRRGYRRCRECTSERDRLIDDAARLLGLSRSLFRRLYGQKRAVAEMVLRDAG